MEPRRVTSRELLKLMEEYHFLKVYVPIFFSAVHIDKKQIKKLVRENAENNPIEPEYVVEFLNSDTILVS